MILVAPHESGLVAQLRFRKKAVWIKGDGPFGLVYSNGVSEFGEDHFKILVMNSEVKGASLHEPDLALDGIREMMLASLLPRLHLDSEDSATNLALLNRRRQLEEIVPVRRVGFDEVHDEFQVLADGHFDSALY